MSLICDSVRSTVDHRCFDVQFAMSRVFNSHCKLYIKYLCNSSLKMALHRSRNMLPISLNCLQTVSHVKKLCCTEEATFVVFFDVLLTVHLSIFISIINQLDAQNFCFTISLFHASTCFEHMCPSSGGQNCITHL